MTEKLPATISFHLESWLENAGIVGLHRILGDRCMVQDQQLTIPTSVLENFSQNYFNFFASNLHYGRLTRFQRIIAFEEQIKKWQADDFSTFDEKALNVLDQWYKDVLKYSAKSKSYQKLYPLINSDFDVLAELQLLDKSLKGLKRKGFLKKFPDEAKEDLRQLCSQLQEVIDYFKRSDSKKYFPAKTLSYTIINNAWNGVSFLNPQAKETDFYVDYQHYFVDPVVDYLAEDHSKDKFICSTCGRPIKRQNMSYGFINGMGYDTARKTSNAWDFSNDQFICPICQLMYSCTSAGFSYNMAKQGIFINYNHSLSDLLKANDAVFETMIQKMLDHGNVSPFRAFTTSFEERLNQSSTYSLAGVQVVTYGDDSYRFTVIPPIAAGVIAKAIKVPFGKKDSGKNLLSVLFAAGISDFRGFNYYSIYDEVIRRLFNSTNLYSLIYELELILNSQPSNIRFNQLHIMALINLNAMFFKELANEEDPIMQVKSEDLSKMRGAGLYVLNYYKDNENGKKANALVYKLLQAVNSGSPEKFMAIILNVYAGQNQLVPSKLINNINQPEVFRQYALAFIAGLIGEAK
ncbi:Cas8a1 family CRISPR/Cas system-associated protein [Limosilactobacillus caccae]|uniref:Cas8a1 family CRISPR/Cas system-associated protein n=1 Tax=Limosilactobacillus caccae TaxID=1926284 RepID=UPI000971250C|nr:Cas8a1 family CRISPR/Cas system-associated protein [Limosilactobacillus caccae]